MGQTIERTSDQAPLFLSPHYRAPPFIACPPGIKACSTVYRAGCSAGTLWTDYFSDRSKRKATLKKFVDRKDADRDLLACNSRSRGKCGGDPIPEFRFDFVTDCGGYGHKASATNRLMFVYHCARMSNKGCCSYGASIQVSLYFCLRYLWSAIALLCSESRAL